MADLRLTGVKKSGGQVDYPVCLLKRVSPVRQARTPKGEWLLFVNGHELRVSTGEVKAYRRLRRLVMEKTHVLLIDMGPSEWRSVLQLLLDGWVNEWRI